MKGITKFWFTADTHFGHVRIIEHAHRPFNDVRAHDETLIKNWNDRVAPGDVVYHLGDFGMPQGFDQPFEYLCSIKSRLRGQVHFIRGNHDRLVAGRLAEMFVSDRLYHTVKVSDADALDGKWQHIVVCHYAFRTWGGSGNGSWNLHGHSHGNLAALPDALQLDVGVDVHGFAPVSYDEVKAHMAARTFKPVDHHGRTKR